MGDSFAFSGTVMLVILLVGALVVLALIALVVVLISTRQKSQQAAIASVPQNFAAPGYPPETSQSLEERTPVIPDEYLYRQPVLGAEMDPYALPPRSPDTRQQ